MFEALFGADMPLAVRFFLAFLIVLGLIGATAWAVRRFGTGRLSATNVRGRQPRLAVIDYASVDARRRLILVRRDNVEHLVMIGGPTDVVVESSIVRAAPVTRESAVVARPAAIPDALPRPIPLPENGNGSWPLQPEPIGSSRPMPRIDPDELQGHNEPSPRPARESLAALADEIAPRSPPRSRPAVPRAEPRVPTSQRPADEESLAEMAHRLEAALRKPKSAAETRDTQRAAAPAPAAEQNVELEAPAPSRGSARSARAEAKTNPGKALYDSLEQEMASLLGRPGGKT
jgi:flagellar protein FliO/FliZ